MEIVEFLIKSKDSIEECIEKRKVAEKTNDLAELARINDEQSQHICDSLQGIRKYISEFKELSEKEPWDSSYSDKITLLEAAAKEMGEVYWKIDKGMKSGKYLTTLPDLSHLIE